MYFVVSVSYHQEQEILPVNAVTAVAAYDGETVGLSVFLNNITHLSVPDSRPNLTRTHTHIDMSHVHIDMSHSTTTTMKHDVL